MQQDDPFFAVPRKAVPTSAGAVELPILYDRVAYFTAVFRIALVHAQEALAPFGLHALSLPGGRAVAVLSFACYRHSTIGPYLECGLAIAAVRPGADPAVRSLLSLWRGSAGGRGIGYAVLQLPVTTGLACAAGRELWGYPKFVTGIQARLLGARLLGEVADPDSGASLLRLTGRTGPGVPSPPVDLLIYSRLDGALLGARLAARGMGWLCTAGSLRLETTPLGHPMARTLAMLGLDGARPALVFRADPLRLRLHAGQALAAGGAAPA